MGAPLFASLLLAREKFKSRLKSLMLMKIFSLTLERDWPLLLAALRTQYLVVVSTIQV